MSANDVDARARALVPPSEVSPTVPSQAESAGLSEVEAAKRLAQYGENALVSIMSASSSAWPISSGGRSPG